MKELLKFGEENGKTVVAGYLTSNFYWADGKVHPSISRTESDLDEGICGLSFAERGRLYQPKRLGCV